MNESQLRNERKSINGEPNINNRRQKLSSSNKPRSVSLLPINLDFLGHSREKGYREMFLERKSLLNESNLNMSKKKNFSASSTKPRMSKSNDFSNNETNVIDREQTATTTKKNYRLSKLDFFDIPPLQLDSKGYKSIFHKTRKLESAKHSNKNQSNEFS